MNRWPVRRALAWGVGRQLIRGVGWSSLFWVVPTVLLCSILGPSEELGWAGVGALHILIVPVLFVLSYRITVHDQQFLEPLVQRLPIPADDVLSIRIVVRLVLGMLFALVCWLAIAAGTDWGSLESGPGLSFVILLGPMALCWIGLLAFEASPTWRKHEYRRGRVQLLTSLYLGIPAVVLLLLVPNEGEMGGGWRTLVAFLLSWGGPCVVLGLSYWLVRQEHRSTYFGIQPERQVPKWFDDELGLLWIFVILALVNPWGFYHFFMLLYLLLELASHLWQMGSRWRNPRNAPRPGLGDWLSQRCVLAIVYALALYWRISSTPATEPSGKEPGLGGSESLIVLRVVLFLLLVVVPMAWLVTRPSRWRRQNLLLARLPITPKDIGKFRARETAQFFLSFALTLVATEWLVSMSLVGLASSWTWGLGWVLGVGLWILEVSRVVAGRFRWWLLPLGPLVVWGALVALPWLVERSDWVASVFVFLVGFWAFLVMVRRCGEPAWPPPPRG